MHLSMEPFRKEDHLIFSKIKFNPLILLHCSMAFVITITTLVLYFQGSTKVFFLICFFNRLNEISYGLSQIKQIQSSRLKNLFECKASLTPCAFINVKLFINYHGQVVFSFFLFPFFANFELNTFSGLINLIRT